MRIKKEIYDEMIQYCKACMPHEACGILAGKDNLATVIYKIENIEASSVSYFMEPVGQLKAMKDIRNRGLEMIAIFHSHPFGSAYPSGKDIELVFYDVFYVIVGFEPTLKVRCFKIEGKKVDEEEIIIV